jgi:hypothetical protein
MLPACATALALAIETAAGGTPATPATLEPTLAQRLCERYARVRTVSCNVVKLTTSAGTSVRMLSRVACERPSRVHVEITAPSRRRIVADGARLYYHEEGARLGFSQPVAELNDTWLASMQNLPGTPLEHLLRLKGMAETVLPPSADAPLRRGYASRRIFIVLSCDTNERLSRIEFFATPEMKEKVAQYDYSEFVDAGGGAWFSRLDKAWIRVPDGGQITELRRVNGLRINEPLDGTLFQADRYFAGITFTNVFAMTGEQAEKPPQ